MTGKALTSKACERLREDVRPLAEAGEPGGVIATMLYNALVSELGLGEESGYGSNPTLLKAGLTGTAAIWAEVYRVLEEHSTDPALCFRILRGEPRH